MPLLIMASVYYFTFFCYSEDQFSFST
uniref:Uncharacterized protein n=1 Tax=Heterorhabditis bacteriophora TaxID=37862 RepID=A0A1I7X165_HETBA